MYSGLAFSCSTTTGMAGITASLAR